MFKRRRFPRRNDSAAGLQTDCAIGVSGGHSSSSSDVSSCTFGNGFPFFPADEFRYEMIHAWQDLMHPSSQLRSLCAICRQETKRMELRQVNARDVELSCLRNNFLQARVLPTTYNFALSNRVILCQSGLEDPWALANMDMCGSC